MGASGVAIPGLSHVIGTFDTPLIEETISAMLDAAARRWPDGDALVSVQEGIRWSWSELSRRIDAVAASLLARGLEPGDRIGIWSPNNSEWILTQFAAARAGLVLVTINPAYRPHELEHTINAVAMKAIVLARRFKTSDYVGMLRAVAPGIDASTPGKLSSARLPSLRLAILLRAEGEPGFIAFDDLCATPSAEALTRLKASGAKHSATDPVTIQFTSGTTGLPKGATLSDRNILNNAAHLARGLGLKASDRLCLPVPLYHCFGMVMGVLGCLTTGATIILPAESFSGAAVVAAIAAERCTVIYGVPTMYLAVLDDPSLPGVDASSLRTGLMSGALCPIELMRAGRDRLNIQNFFICYGMTETSPVSFQTRPDDPVEIQVSTVGVIQPHLEAKIIDADGNTVAVGQTGELCVRGYAVMLGYWGDPAQTARAIDAEGWMHSGDLGVFDAGGNCRIVGRIKDMIIRGGENIYPAEIEAFLRGHPAIRDIHVVGIPDPKFGEAVCACVMPAPDASVALQDIIDFCRDRIAHYKIPAHLHIFEEFPMTVTGKVQKFALREIVMGQRG